MRCEDDMLAPCSNELLGRNLSAGDIVLQHAAGGFCTDGVAVVNEHNRYARRLGEKYIVGRVADGAEQDARHVDLCEHAH